MVTVLRNVPRVTPLAVGARARACISPRTPESVYRTVWRLRPCVHQLQGRRSAPADRSPLVTGHHLSSVRNRDRSPIVTAHLLSSVPDEGGTSRNA